MAKETESFATLWKQSPHVCVTGGQCTVKKSTNKYFSDGLKRNAILKSKDNSRCRQKCQSKLTKIYKKPFKYNLNLKIRHLS